MPIPLLFMGIGIGSAVFGIGKSIKAGVDQSEANETNDRANAIIKRSKQTIETCRKNCGKAINNLGIPLPHCVAT